jgi:hypothetical protein
MQQELCVSRVVAIGREEKSVAPRSQTSQLTILALKSKFSTPHKELVKPSLPPRPRRYQPPPSRIKCFIRFLKVLDFTSGNSIDVNQSCYDLSLDYYLLKIGTGPYGFPAPPIATIFSTEHSLWHSCELSIFSNTIDPWRIWAVGRAKMECKMELRAPLAICFSI